MTKQKSGEQDGFQAARRASGLTIEDAAKAMGVSVPCYATARRNDQGTFRLRELRGLYGAMTDQARYILEDAVLAFLRSEV